MNSSVDNISNLDDADLCYRLRLLIRHGEQDLSVVSELTGLKANVFTTKGGQRISPDGKILPGTHQTNTWSYWSYVTRSRKISYEIDKLLEKIKPCEELFFKLVRSGGQAMLIIDLEGRSNIGDVLPPSVLAGMVRNSLSLGIELFPEFRK